MKPNRKNMPKQKGVLKRAIKSVFHFYPAMLTIALIDRKSVV